MTHAKVGNSNKAFIIPLNVFLHRHLVKHERTDNLTTSFLLLSGRCFKADECFFTEARLAIKT